MSRQENWCFTLNNYSEDEYASLLETLKECRYFIVGKEVGDGGTPHLQGYACFPRRYTFNALRNKFGSRYHLEGARGTPRQNREYCSKGGDFAEGGELPEVGAANHHNRGRTEARIEAAKRFRSCLARGNRGLVEFADSFPDEWVYNGLNMLRNTQSLITPIERPNIDVEWVYGQPGVGKSRYAHDKFPEAYIKEPRTKWWNGYLQEKEVIIDDFGPNGIDINHLLRWFDRYKCLVETKGGMVSLYADKFIVTSNFHPEELFKWGDAVNPQLPALLRRVRLVEM